MGGRQKRFGGAPKQRVLRFEWLEGRQLLTASAIATPQLVTATPDASKAAPVGFTPAQIDTAYALSNLTVGGTKLDGSGETIAIVDAYNDPKILSDLTTFSKQYNLPLPTSSNFQVVNQAGGSSLPASNSGWAEEISLDVEWAHAVAPGAKILLVEAKSANSSDLDAAEDYARSAPGVVVVSNSWGSSEYSTESSEDVHFTTPSGHAGVTFIVAAGDDGGTAEYPSSSPDVLSVGGTSLTLSSSGTWQSETVWNDGGGGTSRYEGKPSYQSGATTASYRSTPDVSADANPSTGVEIYDSYGDPGWEEIGGTSAAAPQWAGIMALVDQGRALSGESSLGNAQAAVYSLSKDFHDITSGSNGNRAASGYDLASGLGTPEGNLLVPGLIAYTGSTSFTVSTPTQSGGGGLGLGGFGGGWGWGGWGGFGFGFGGFGFGFFDAGAGGGADAGASPSNDAADNAQASLAGGNSFSLSTPTPVAPSIAAATSVVASQVANAQTVVATSASWTAPGTTRIVAVSTSSAGSRSELLSAIDGELTEFDDWIRRER